MRARLRQQTIFVAAGSVLPPVVITFLLWLTGENDVSPPQILIAVVLSYPPWFSYLSWRKKEKKVLPLFTMLSLMYWLYYVVPLFWSDRMTPEAFQPLGRDVPDVAITLALLMALLGVTALWLGMRLKLARGFKFNTLSSLELKSSQLNYLRVVLVISCVLNFWEGLPNQFGGGARQLISILITTIPSLAFVVLMRNHVAGRASTVDKFLIAFFLMASLLTGLSSGWLGSFASIILMCAAIYVAELRRFPRFVTLIAVVFVLFFQVGKYEFRQAYWTQESQPSGKVERVLFWTDASLSKWSEVITDPNSDSIRDALSPSIARVSLLTQAANVIDQTPTVVPYQYGRLYSYMAITLIPRFIWPEKPSVSDANRYYQVAYGLTNEEDLANVSIAVGVLAEGFMNFGWPGAIVIMFLLGMFFNVYENIFFSRTSGAFMVALGIVLLPPMLAIEAQMAGYLGGLVQHVLISLLVFFPVIRVRHLRSQHPAEPSHRISSYAIVAQK